MHLVLISNGFQPDYEVGFANGLAANGLHPILIASDRTLLERLSPDVSPLNIRGAQGHQRRGLLKAVNIVIYLLRLWWLLLRTRPVVHLTGLFTLGHLRSPWADRTWRWECRILRALSSRLVLTVHNVVPHDRDTPAVRRQLADVYHIPDLLVVHTNKAKQRLIDEFEVPSERVLVMEHGIDRLVEPSEDRVREVRRSLGLSAKDHLALFFGSVARYKGVDLLISAVDYLGPDVHVHIAGHFGDKEYSREIDALLASLPSTARLTVEKGFLSEERVSDLLSAADVLVMPYRHIDQSGVLFSAMKHGLPVAAFDVGSLSDYLTGALGTAVAPGDVQALAAAIRDITHASADSATILAIARRYLWSTTVQVLLPYYRAAHVTLDA